MVQNRMDATHQFNLWILACLIFSTHKGTLCPYWITTKWINAVGNDFIKFCLYSNLTKVVVKCEISHLGIRLVFCVLTNSNWQILYSMSINMLLEYFITSHFDTTRCKNTVWISVMWVNLNILDETGSFNRAKELSWNTAHHTYDIERLDNIWTHQFFV